MKPRDTTHAERVEIVERHTAGETLSAIAQSLGLNRYTVRHWWRAFREAGWSALVPPPSGPPEVGPLGHFHPLVKYVALRLKRTHPSWGAPVLRLHMRDWPSLCGLKLPANTALWSYLHQFGNRLLVPRRLLTKRPETSAMRATAPHECWEMDFKGDETVAGCAIVVFPLGLVDEASGAPLIRAVHMAKAKGNHQGITMRHVQADLRQAFSLWGLPDAIRMDRDPLFIGSTHFGWPGTLLLWLVGLGIQPIINRAYRPTDNGMIERAHRTWRSDVIDGVPYATLLDVQAASDQALEDRRCSLPTRHPACHGQPPMVAFPTLRQPRRSYQPAQEATLFDLQRVDAYLAQWEWRRLVDSTGKISLANHNKVVDRRYASQIVKVRFDPSTRQFVCATLSGDIVARLTLDEVGQDYILDTGGIT